MRLFFKLSSKGSGGARRRRRGFYPLLVAAAMLLPLPASAQQFSQMIVFGSSLEDTGNLFALTGFPPAPYFNGRFSNGPVWVEQLAPRLGMTYNPATNFAYGGARTDTTHLAGPFPGIQTQVDTYLSSSPAADPNALYILWGGANDYLNGGQTDPAVPVGNLSAQLSALAARGARTILVPNQSDLGSIPGTSGTAASTPLNLLTAGHNAGLVAALDSLHTTFPDTRFLLLDVNSLYNEVVAAPTTFGLVNVTTGFLPAGAGDPNTFLFWDEMHPTTVGHALIADRAVGVLASPIPEPGTLALLGVGLLPLVREMTRRRRRAQ